jgi:hypothetical protein
MAQKWCIVVYLQLELVKSVSHIKASSERHNKIEKEKLSAEVISSKGNC